MEPSQIPPAPPQPSPLPPAPPTPIVNVMPKAPVGYTAPTLTSALSSTRWPVFAFVFTLFFVLAAGVVAFVPQVRNAAQSALTQIGVLEDAQLPLDTTPPPLDVPEPITLQQARALAYRTMIELDGPEKIRARTATLNIFDARTATKPYGWVFFWNSKDFIATLDPRERVPNAAPIIVSLFGDVTVLPTSTPAAPAILQYEIDNGFVAPAPEPPPEPSPLPPASSTPENAQLPL